MESYGKPGGREKTEAEIRHEEGFEVITRRRCWRATGEEMKELVEDVGLCRSSSRKDISCCGVSAAPRVLAAKAPGGEGQMASGFSVQ